MNRRQPQSTSSAPYANHTARARAAPPAIHGGAAGPNSGARASHSTAAPYAPATKKLGTPRYDRAPHAATTAAINRATAPAPTSAPSVLVVTSTMLAVRTGENTCRPSTVALSARPTSVARRISARTAPEGDVTTHTAPRPAKRTVFRRPSIASRHP